MIKIRYQNSVDVAGIAYPSVGAIIPEVYLDVDVGRPIYAYSEEGDEQTDGSFRRTFARVEKQYTIQTYLQEYMVDALMVAQLHDYVEVYLSNDTVMAVNEFRVSDPEWDGVNGLAKVTITFIVYQDIASNDCDVDDDCDSLTQPTFSITDFSDGYSVAQDYIYSVEAAGGVVMDEDDVIAIYEMLGVVDVPTTLKITAATCTENSLNEIWTRQWVDGAWTTWIENSTVTGSTLNAASVSSPVDILTPYYIVPYTDNGRFGIKIRSYVYGCVGVWSTEVVYDTII